MGRIMLDGMTTNCNDRRMSIKHIIEASGRARSDIIADAGISQSHFALIESGQRKIGLRHIAALAAALGVSPADLRPDWAELVGRG